jgi:serine/threonine-protein phosphatase 2A regulatory subunit B''
MVATPSIKMDELLITWLGSDVIYENVMKIIEQQKESNNKSKRVVNDGGDAKSSSSTTAGLASYDDVGDGCHDRDDDAGAGVGGGRPPLSPHQSQSPSRGGRKTRRTRRRTVIPPFFRRGNDDGDAPAKNASSSSGAPLIPPPSPPKRRTNSSFEDDQTWDGIYMTNPEGGGGGDVVVFDQYSDGSHLASAGAAASSNNNNSGGGDGGVTRPCIALRARALFQELGVALSSSHSSPTSHQDVSVVLRMYLRRNDGDGSASSANEIDVLRVDDYHRTEEDCTYVPIEKFERITKELCNLPTFFHKPLYARILMLWEEYLERPSRVKEGGTRGGGVDDEGDGDTGGRKLPSLSVVTYGVFRRFWEMEMAPYDMNERFFRLVKRPDREYITRGDFFPYIKELLNDHPGLEFLANHAEFQDKYAVTVITRIFYSVNLCHSGRITSRQVRKSNLLSVFQQVDEEEDINKVTKYFSYEHFYVLYCRFWELDHDRDYKITREDLLKYGEHSLSHMIVDRIFEAAPRPFEGNDAATSLDENEGNAVAPRKMTREYLTYEDFIFFMLSEEDKANEYSVRYWFTCVDVDGDDRLNNMEMRSFYAVQLHRMQCMGHEVVPFEDMLCQMVRFLIIYCITCSLCELFGVCLLSLVVFVSMNGKGRGRKRGGGKEGSEGMFSKEHVRVLGGGGDQGN